MRYKLYKFISVTLILAFLGQQEGWACPNSLRQKSFDERTKEGVVKVGKAPDPDKLNPDGYILVATIGTATVGTVKYAFRPGLIAMSEINATPKRHGIGQILLEQLILEALRTGRNKIVLFIIEANWEAIEFYKAIGRRLKLEIDSEVIPDYPFNWYQITYTIPSAAAVELGSIFRIDEAQI